MNKIFKPITYTKQSEDDDVAAIFVSSLEILTYKIYNDFYRKPIPIKLDMKRNQEYYSATKCHICGGKLGEDRVRTTVTLLEFIEELLIIGVTCNVESQ